MTRKRPRTAEAEAPAPGAPAGRPELSELNVKALVHAAFTKEMVAGVANFWECFADDAAGEESAETKVLKADLIDSAVLLTGNDELGSAHKALKGGRKADGSRWIDVAVFAILVRDIPAIKAIEWKNGSQAARHDQDGKATPPFAKSVRWRLRSAAQGAEGVVEPYLEAKADGAAREEMRKAFTRDGESLTLLTVDGKAVWRPRGGAWEGRIPVPWLSSLICRTGASPRLPALPDAAPPPPLATHADRPSTNAVRVQKLAAAMPHPRPCWPTPSRSPIRPG